MYANQAVHHIMQPSRMRFCGSGSSSKSGVIVDRCDSMSVLLLDSNYDRLSASGTLKSLRRNSPSVSRLERDMPENGSQHLSASSRIASFFAKRSFRAQNPLKRTKSVTKLDRNKSTNAIDHLDHSSLENPNHRYPKKTLLSPPHLQQCSSRVTRSHESIVAAIRSGEMLMTNGMNGLHPQPHPIPPPARYVAVDDEWKFYDFSKNEDNKENSRSGVPHRCPLESAAPSFPRRTDHVLKLWLQEAKGLPSKKRYFCEVYLDQTLYARTSCKAKQDLLFWGEQFEFGKLPVIQTLEVHLYREMDKKRGRKEKQQLIGKVIAPISALSGGHMTERWYPVILKRNSGVKSDDTAIRIKARHQVIHILPLEKYHDLVEYIKSNYGELCRFLEPRVGIKAKEELATCLVNVMHKLGLSSVFLVDIVMEELSNLDDCHLTFRGNSLATKAMEAFMKLAGNRYLHEALGDLIRALMDAEDDCEVDPTKLSPETSLSKQQEAMMMIVEMTWAKIINSTRYFPAELREVFQTLRDRLTVAGRPELADTLISGCIFLRFLCPAILSPSLFGLVQEYPNQKIARNLTLIAKTVQTLANFNKFSGKESYMEFMNTFVERELPSMNTFLRLISSPAPANMNGIMDCNDDHVDIGRELATLQTLLRDNLANLNQQNQPPQNRSQLGNLPDILDTLHLHLSASLRIPNDAQSAMYSTYLSREVQEQLLSKLQNMHSSCKECQQESKSLTRSTNYLLGSSQRPARNLNTADDYVLYSAIDSNQRIQHKSLVKLAINGDYVDLVGLEKERGSQTSISQQSSGYQSSSLPAHTQSCASCSPIATNSEGSPRLKNQRQSFIEKQSRTRLSSSSDSAQSSLSSGTPPRDRRSIPRTNPLFSQNGNPNVASNPPSPKLGMRAFGDTEKRRLKCAKVSRKSSLSPDRASSEGKQYDSEIDELRGQLTFLQVKLQEAERKLSSQEQTTEKVIIDWKNQIEAGEERVKREQIEKDQQMRSIVVRLISVEEELRREQAELMGMMKAKQKVIEAQERKIESLNAANQRLLATLSQLKESSPNRTRNSSLTGRTSPYPNSPNIRDVRAGVTDNGLDGLSFLNTPEARELRSSSC